jgi:glycosyltransferase involved in cell wall biosynthesis
VGRKTVVMLNVSETSRDPRVRRVSETLSRQGHRVVAIGPKGELSTAWERYGGFEIKRFDGPRSFTHADMAEIERLSPRAADIVRTAARDVMDLVIDPVLLARRRWHRRGARALRWADKALPHEITSRSVPPLRRALAIIDPPSEVTEVIALRSMMLINLEMAKAAMAFRPDIIHANDLNTMLAALIVKEKTGAPIIYDAHEIYPEQHAPDQRSELWHGFFTRLDEQLIHQADGRMTVCDSLGEYFQRRYGSPAFLTLRNVPSIRFLPRDEILARRNEPRRILYHGAFFKNRGLEEVIRAAKYLTSAQFIFRGFGTHEPVLRNLVEEIGAEANVHFAPPVSVDELVRTASESDVGLNPFPSACLNTEYALPNKFFEYMMAGLSIASSDLIEMRRLTNELGIGILFRSLNPEEIAADLRTLLADPERLDAHRANGWRAARERFHWEQEEQRLIEYYRPFAA